VEPSTRPSSEPTSREASTGALDALVEVVASSRRLLVLTGAGCSTESGIPDYRDADGGWKARRPMLYRDFVASAANRRRYWARSMVGWLRIARAQPNGAHRALARLEHQGPVHHLVTQNVDSLHQRSGSRRVIDLHGRLDRVECLECRMLFQREAFQNELRRLNPTWQTGVETERITPDGDAELAGADYDAFRVPGCPCCGGDLKPWVVFFGESVPKGRTRRAFEALEEADALLVVGSSLMVWSGYRFARRAAADGKPVAIVNRGRTRADGEATVKVEGACGEVLGGLVDRLGIRSEGDRSER